MKSPVKLLALAVAVTALTTSAFADGQVVFGRNNANYRQGQGGEFTLKVVGTDTDHLMNDYPYYADGHGTQVNWLNSSGATVGTGFETFCLQRTEYMNFNTTFYYHESTAARSNSGTPDEISLGTSWLYGQFAQGLLTNYVYALGYHATGLHTRAASAEMLQNAIWYLEDEFTGNATQQYAAAGGASNIFLAAAISHFTGLGLNAHDDALGYNLGVVVLNLGTKAGDYSAQDQLAWPRPNPVPEQGTTIALLGLALVGLAGFRRKFVK